MKTWLRAMRTANGYTQQELARAAGMRFMALRQELLETLEEEGDPMELLDSLYELKARIEQLEQSLIEDPDD